MIWLLIIPSIEMGAWSALFFYSAASGELLFTVRYHLHSRP